MKNVIFLLTKDCMSCESLPVYGNKYWNTPNIDELANKGTIFRKHYTAAASTAMAMSAMLTGHYPYEFKSRKIYTNVKPSEFPSIFDKFQSMGIECHLVWDLTWMDMAWRFVREFGDENKTIIHNLDIAQPAGGHKKDNSKLVRNDDLLNKTYRQIFDTLNSIDLTRPQFIWMHLPHVLKGRRSYMDDMDVFDEIVGFVRNLVGDDSIFLTTDHGHMNMHKGKVGYGFDVYEPIIHIPLITPRILGQKEVNYLTCNVDLPVLLFERKMPERSFVVSETAYYGQLHRITSICDGRFKYVYNKKNHFEELYDLEWDPSENYNILIESYYDKNRKTQIIYDELYFYPYRELAYKHMDELKKHKEEFWIRASWLYEHYAIARKKLSFIKRLYKKIRRK